MEPSDAWYTMYGNTADYDRSQMPSISSLQQTWNRKTGSTLRSIYWNLSKTSNSRLYRPAMGSDVKRLELAGPLLTWYKSHARSLPCEGQPTHMLYGF